MNDKKVAGILAAVSGISALAYLLTRKQPTPPPPPQKYKCPQCDETFGTYEALLAHIQADHPGEPPPEVGYITGVITDKLTGAKVANATIYLDWALDCHSDVNGTYVTSYTKYGAHTLLVEADNYGSNQEFQVTTNSQVTTFDIQLEHVPDPLPGEDWMQDISIKSMTLTPSTVYPGQEVQIQLEASYRCDAPRPILTTGRLHIDGEIISKEFEVGYYNPTFYFHYTPQMPGTYTISSGGSGAILTVLREEVAHYFSPFGGVRWPLITDILFPDVAPFTVDTWEFPGGDLKFSDIVANYKGWIPDPWISAHTQYFQGPYAQVSYFALPFDFLANYVQTARVAATDTPDCPIDKYGILPRTFDGYTGPIAGLLAMITDKQGCPDYWDSKEALAQMIGRYKPTGGVRPVYPPSELVTPYHVTCQWCGGTGLMDCAVGRIGCMFCLGTAYGAPQYAGKLYPFDIYKGVRDWTWPPFVYGDCRWASREQHHYSIYCPYCQAPFTTGDLGTTSWYEPQRIAWARQFLQHIESNHPTHPLTEPAWF
jgi:hypothetical protein